jgi:hypothetical protein
MEVKVFGLTGAGGKNIRMLLKCHNSRTDPRMAEDDPETLRALRQGWCLGGEDFRQEMIERMEGRLGEHHAGELRQESAEAKAERIVQEEVKRLGLERRGSAGPPQERSGKTGDGGAFANRNDPVDPADCRSSSARQRQKRKGQTRFVDESPHPSVCATSGGSRDY